METYALTHQGLKREENQDRFFIREFEDQTILMAVADGMGGEAGGGLAAQIVVDAAKEFTSTLPAIEVSLDDLFQKASQRIAEEVRKEPRLEGMGTTLTTVYIKNGITTWAHVGDSRLYLFRAGVLTQITEDHTYVNRLVKEGVITKEQAWAHPLQNILLQCVGCQPIEISRGQFKNAIGDVIFLSTDGLHQEVAEGKIISILTKEVDIRKIIESLIWTALKAGGRDNVTVAGVKI